MAGTNLTDVRPFVTLSISQLFYTQDERTTGDILNAPEDLAHLANSGVRQ
jgi:hypothetical protein